MRSSNAKNDVAQEYHCAQESEWAIVRVRYSIVNKTTNVVSRPKSVRVDAGSV
jgi:hypothetical protein